MKSNVNAMIVFILLALKSVNETVELELGEIKDYIDENKNAETFRSRLETEEQETKTMKRVQQNLYNETEKLNDKVTDIEGMLQENLTRKLNYQDSKIVVCKILINEHKFRAEKRMDDLENQISSNKDKIETLQNYRNATNMMKSTGVKSQNETIRFQKPNVTYPRGKLYFSVNLSKYN